MKTSIRKMVMALLTGVMCLALAGCGSRSYEEINNDYSLKLEEYYNTAKSELQKEADSGADYNALAQSCTEKVNKLAGICQEGITEMAQKQTKDGGDSSEYVNFSSRLEGTYLKFATELEGMYISNALNGAGDVLDQFSQEYGDAMQQYNEEMEKAMDDYSKQMEDILNGQGN